MSVPVIDVSPLLTGAGLGGVGVADATGAARAADGIGRACREQGFFYVKGHGVSEELQGSLESAARAFFEQPEDTKQRVRMELGGRAWRGYFPVGGELTSGRPDLKEGLYFGSELGRDDPRVQAGVPMHGPNLFPADPSGLRDAVLGYMGALTHLGHALMRGIALSLGLEPDYFRERYMADPLVLFRIFHYPPSAPAAAGGEQWGVGEHTDYGVLTILKQDEVGGLQVKTPTGWIEAPPVPGAFVCNIGDMLDRLTRGLYRSTPHRVLNRSGRDRYSFPFFFDPGFEAVVEPVDTPEVRAAAAEAGDRWDGADVHAFRGTYGDYILGKVAKVFPELGETGG